jgi:hypothetical protein
MQIQYKTCLLGCDFPRLNKNLPSSCDFMLLKFINLDSKYHSYNVYFMTLMIFVALVFFLHIVDDMDDRISCIALSCQPRYDIDRLV